MTAAVPAEEIDGAIHDPVEAQLANIAASAIPVGADVACFFRDGVPQLGRLDRVHESRFGPSLVLLDRVGRAFVHHGRFEALEGRKFVVDRSVIYVRDASRHSGFRRVAYAAEGDGVFIALALEMAAAKAAEAEEAPVKQSGWSYDG